MSGHRFVAGNRQLEMSMIGFQLRMMNVGITICRMLRC